LTYILFKNISRIATVLMLSLSKKPLLTQWCQLTKENMEIQEQIKQIKSRQLGRLITQLKAVNTPQIIIDATEKYFNFFYLDILELENQRKSGTKNDKSNKNNF
jgi:hypothetical protein